MFDVLLRLALRGCGRLHADTADRVGAALGILAFHLGVRRRLVSAQLHRSLGITGNARRTLNRRSYASVGANFLSVLTGGGPGGLEQGVSDPHPTWTRRMSGSGLVFVSSHVGNWEAGVTALHRWLGPTRAFIKPVRNAALMAAVNAGRSCTGALMEGTDPKDKSAAIRVLRHLRQGGVAGVMGDQRALAGEAVPGWFLGQPSWCHPGAAVLARRSGARNVPGTCVRRRAGRYTLLLGRPITLSHLDDLAATQVVMDRLAALAAAWPGQYFWQHRRWRHDDPHLEARTDHPWRTRGLRLISDPEPCTSTSRPTTISTNP